MNDTIKGADERELLPCPFCGHKTAPKMTDSEEYYGEFFDDSSDVFFAVICDASKPKSIGGCGAAGGFARTEEEAIAKWNLRASLGAAQVPDITDVSLMELADRFRFRYAQRGQQHQDFNALCFGRAVIALVQQGAETTSAAQVPSEDARDAARYRFVRVADSVRISSTAARDPIAYDAAIDAAIEALSQQGDAK